MADQVLAFADLLAQAIRLLLSDYVEEQHVSRLWRWSEDENWLVLDGTERTFLPVAAEHATTRLGPTLHGLIDGIGWRVDLPELCDTSMRNTVLDFMTALGYPVGTDG